MRIITYAAFVLLTATLFVSAQAAGPPENIKSVLRGWEKAMVDLQSFACEVQRTTTDNTFNSKDEFRGFAMFMKPVVKNDGSRARLQLVKVKNDKVNPEIFEKYIVTGPFLYEYAPATKMIRIHDMPQSGKAGAQQESFLSFLFGMSAEDAMSRYELNLRYLQGGKPDPNYHYIHVVPKSQKDKIDFREAYLTLYRANNLPAQIRYTHANNNVIEWNFTKVQINVNIPADKYFVPEDMPGWRTERVKPILPQAGPAVRPTSK